MGGKRHDRHPANSGCSRSTLVASVPVSSGSESSSGAASSRAGLSFGFRLGTVGSSGIAPYFSSSAQCGLMVRDV